jgi:hypothetical protein
MTSEKNIVQVTTQTAALSSPNFVIEHEGRLYVTLALLEYDPKAPNLSAEQKRGVKQMQQMFKEARQRGSLNAAQLDAGWRSIGPVNSGPNPPAPEKGPRKA